MASPLTEKTLIQIRSFQDPETGCSASDKAALELCKQSFYLKQQNEILQQQSDSRLQQENTELKTQLETMRQEIETLKTQQTVSQPTAQANNNLLAASVSGVTLPTLLLVAIVLIGAAFLIGRKFMRRQ